MADKSSPEVVLPVELPCTDLSQSFKYAVEVVSGVKDTGFLKVSGSPVEVKVEPVKIEMEGKSGVEALVKISSTVGSDTIPVFIKLTLYQCLETDCVSCQFKQETGETKCLAIKKTDTGKGTGTG